MTGAIVRRRFIDVGAAQVHARVAGPESGQPLVAIHPSPGSSKQLETLVEGLADEGFFVVAPDTAGNGDSTPLSTDTPTINDLADHAVRALDSLVPGPFDLYGSHTGASIAMEIAIAHPGRVGRLILDGMGLYAADLKSEVLDRYAREIRPDAEATHLMKVWHFCRDQYLFWPYYNRTDAGRLPNGLPDDDTLHDFVVEVLKAMRSYHRSYRAAFRHPKRDRLPLIDCPTLVISSPSDMLHEYAGEVASLVKNARQEALLPWADPAHHGHTVKTIAAFLHDD